MARTIRGIALLAFLLALTHLGPTTAPGDVVAGGGLQSTDVTRFDDPVPDGCRPNDCSLREAVLIANERPGLEVIRLPAGTYLLSLAGRDEDAGLAGDIDITDTVGIFGEGAMTTVIDAGGIDRIFDMRPRIGDNLLFGVELLTLRNGRAEASDAADSGSGGAIRGSGYGLGVYSAVLVDNRAGTSGGAVYSVAYEFRSEGSTFERNRVDSDGVGGGAVYLDEGGFLGQPDGATRIDRTTLLDNSAPKGGALFGASPSLIQNSTFVDNEAPGGGAAVYADSETRLASVTISGSSGGAMQSGSGTVDIRRSIISESLGGPNCTGVGIQSSGYNLDDDGSCGFATEGDLGGVDPMVGPLTDNGGGTRTMRLLPGSPAIDAGGSDCSRFDQRHTPRPQDGNSDGVPYCDIGAVEMQDPQCLPRGDVNLDGRIDAVDAVLVLQYIAELVHSISCRGDIDANGWINSLDAYYMHAISALLPGPTFWPN